MPREEDPSICNLSRLILFPQNFGEFTSPLIAVLAIEIISPQNASAQGTFND